jgi:hypothetical protein
MEASRLLLVVENSGGHHGCQLDGSGFFRYNDRAKEALPAE